MFFSFCCHFFIYLADNRNADNPLRNVWNLKNNFINTIPAPMVEIGTKILTKEAPDKFNNFYN